MKLLLFTEFFPNKTEAFSGGVEARMYYLASYLNTQKNLNYQILNRPKIQVSASSLSVLSRLWFQLTSVYKIYKLKPKIIEASNVTTYIPGFIGGKLVGAKVVMWLPDILGTNWFFHFSFLPALFGFLSEWLALHLTWDGVIFLSQSTKSKSPNRLKKNSTVIYGGVDFKLTNKISIKKSVYPKYIVASRLVNYKRIDIIVRAFKKLNDKLPASKLVIIGNGPEKNSLEKLVKDLNLETKVEFYKPLEDHKDLLETMASSTALVSMSLVEGFGLVVVEAMSVGTPYIHSNIPVTREITDNGKGGILVDINSIDQLTKAMKILATDKKTYQQKLKESDQVLKNFSWDEINNLTVSFYQKVYER